MQLFITDNEETYTKYTLGPKLLFIPCQFTASNFIDQTQLRKLNIELSNVEYEAAELMLERLKTDCKTFSTHPFVCSAYQATRAPYDRLYSLLYYASWHVLLPVNALALCLRALIKSDERFKTAGVLLRLSDKNLPLKGVLSDQEKKLFSFEFYPATKPVTSSKKLIKNIFYTASRLFKSVFLKRPGIKKGQKHVVLFLYDIPSVHAVVLPFIEMVKQNSDGIFLSIVEISTGVEANNRQRAQGYRSENIEVYNFEDFRSRVPSLHADFYSFFEKQDPLLYNFKNSDPLWDMELKYSWVNSAIEKLNPSASIYLGVLEHGRAISDVSRFHNIPSINVEYAMFTDDPLFMESNIEFSARACISPNSAEIWKKRGDPTKKHFVTGYCKLDGVNTDHYSKTALFKKYDLDLNARTICFASTWSGGFEFNTLEKKLWIEKLSALCHSKKWNLVIKKHPAESDTIAEELISANGYSCQVVLPHKGSNTYEVIFSSDILCTQSSGIVVEGLYFNKPFCYLSVNSEKNKGAVNMLAREAGVHTFFDSKELEAYLTMLFAENNRGKEFAAFEGLKEKYLYKCDGNATWRLFELVLKDGN